MRGGSHLLEWSSTIVFHPVALRSVQRPLVGSLAQFADFVLSRTALFIDHPHPVNLFRPETLKGADSYPALQSTAFEEDVVEWGSGRSVEHVMV